MVATSTAACSLRLVVRRTALAGSGRPAYVLDPHAGGGPGTPVILVHGLAASPTCWFALRRALRGQGRTVMSFDYTPWARSVDELADRLVEAVTDLLVVTGADKVHLVGHSLGGVIIAQALSRDPLAGRVDLVVTLGSPFGGSPWAAMCPVVGPPLVRAVRPGSRLLRRLAEEVPHSGVRWLAFGAALDAVVPLRRAFPPFRQARCIVVDGAGHSGMLLDPDVIGRIVATVAESDGNDPALSVAA
jgi:pimeloyl-ACP methyl ester carboxylesterase